MRKISVAAGIAAGAVLFFPAVASAGSVAETLSVKVSGTSVTLYGTCVGENVVAEGYYGVRNGHEPYLTGVMKADGHRQTITFDNIKPGKYIAAMFCRDNKAGRATVVDFTIPGKKPVAPPSSATTPQVGKKPQGAPQTGGGPADDESGSVPLVVGGSAAGAAAVAGAGFWLLRRRRA